LIQPGETFELKLTAKNVGEGKALETLATLKNVSGKGIYIKQGRAKLDVLEADKTKTATFTFKVLPRFPKGHAELEIGILDNALREYVTEKLKLRVEDKGEPVVVARKEGVEVTAANAGIRAGPEAAAPLVAHAKKGTLLGARGNVPGWMRVKLPEGTGWVASGDVTGGAKEPAGNPAVSTMRAPPKLKTSFNEKDLLTNAPTLRLTGEATDAE